MTMIAVKCPIYGGTKVSKNEKTENGHQRYICNDKACPEKPFLLEYTYNGWKPCVDEQVINMAANASGIRDTSRVLKVSKQKVSDTLKKHQNQ